MKISNRLGTYVKQSITSEAYDAFIPAKLPPEPPLELGALYPLIEQATTLIGELNTLAKCIPNKSLFVYMYVRKEALLSSQIEGTQSSFADLLIFENEQKPNVSIDDVEEVSNYVLAINHGLKRLDEGFPLCLRLIKEMHAILLQGGRGAQKSPGEFRQSQNWIGGTRPGNAIFVPPPPDQLPHILSEFEAFFHDESIKLPVLIKAALAHVQFETIHPFLDGNGRLGRLLIILLLCEGGLLKQPTLYISLYFKENRKLYYDLLQEVHLQGTWETWIEFFLNGIVYTCHEAITTANNLNKLFDEDLIKINTLGRAKFSCIDVFDYLKKCPQVTVSSLTEALEMTPPTARSALTHLLELGIVEEISGKQRDKIYVYKAYLAKLERGAAPL